MVLAISVGGFSGFFFNICYVILHQFGLKGDEDNFGSDNFNVDAYDDTNMPRFYWGGEDLCELIFYDET